MRRFGLEKDSKGRRARCAGGLVSEVKTKTYRHACTRTKSERGATERGERTHMLVLLGLTSRVCITEAFLFYGAEVRWTEWLLSLFTK